MFYIKESSVVKNKILDKHEDTEKFFKWFFISLVKALIPVAALYKFQASSFNLKL